MKKNLLYIVTMITMLLISQFSMGTNPSLGTAANFVLFTTNGGVSNTGLSQLTGNVGAKLGSVTGFGNVNGGMHNLDGVAATAASDLLTAYNLLYAAIPTGNLAPLLGNGQTLNAGIYSIESATTLNNTLYLDAQGDANAEFTIKIGGAFSSSALSQVVLLNNAKACNVFWKVEGLISLATGTIMKGNMIANNGAITLNSGVQLEGRALSTAGAITVNGVTASTPVGCGSPVLSGPTAPDLKSVSCFAVFSGNGAVTNSGISLITGDVGTNVTLTTGFQELNVTGMIHPIPDATTATVAADLIVVQNYLNNLPADIELLYPAQFGNDLVLTPHTYLLNAATVLTGTVTLNALGNTDAIFVLKITGALSTTTYAKVLLANGAQAKNVYWKVTGAVAINDYSEFVGNIISNNGAMNIKTGAVILGRALTTSGAVSTEAVNIVRQSPCVENPTGLLANTTKNVGSVKVINNAIKITLPNTNSYANLVVFNATGIQVLTKSIAQVSSTINTEFKPGIYFYKLSSNNKITQTGKFIVK